jgi:capsular polysaccharide transport system permease protein
MPDPTALDRTAQLPAKLEAQALPASLEEARQVSNSVSRALRRAARKARTPASIISGGSGIRARKGDRAFRLGIVVSFCVMFGGPLLVESAYWGLIASNQYSTEVKFAVRAGQASPLDALGGLFGLGASQQGQDTQIVADYIKSRTMVEALDKKLDLRRMFSYDAADYFSRFDPTKSIEDLEKYWRKRVDVKIEGLSGIVSVGVRAFTPEDSLALGQQILVLSEALVNDLSSRSRRDALAESRTELDRAEARLQIATSAMRDARNAEGVLDAKASAEALDQVVSALRLEKARLEQDLSTQSRTLAHSPSAHVLEARIAAVARQIDDYSRQIAGARSGARSSMADRLGQLSRQQVDLDLARQQYSQAAAMFQNARVNLETQQAYLVTSLRPTLPEEATYPRRWWEWSIIVVPSLLAWALVATVAFLIRDNMAK